MQVWCLLALENVVGDDADIGEMSSVLGSKPLLFNGVSRVRRPRLYWSNVMLEGHESYSRAHYELYDKVMFETETEPLELIPDEGWH